MSANVRKLRRPLLLAILAVIYAIPFFALDGFGAAYLKFDGIDGESIAKGYEKYIEVDSWGFEAAREVVTGSSSGGTGSPLGDLKIQPFTFDHNYDLASPLLALRCFDGAPIPTATLRVNRIVSDGGAGTTTVDFLVFTFTDVFIKSVSNGGDESSQQENVEFVSQKVKMEYTEYDQATGQKKATKWAEWDALKGVASGG